MGRANETPKTAFATFTITPRDVGTLAVRPGHMAELEEERLALLIAAKIALQRSKDGQAGLDSITEHALQAAVLVAEATF